MKKILLFILLFIPFVTKAENQLDFKKVWESKDNNYFRGTYYADNTYIKFSERILKSINRYTGKDSYLEVANGYQLFHDNKVLIIKTEKDGYTYARTYDEKLSEINSIKLGRFDMDYCTMNEAKEIIISGEYQDDNKYHRVLLFIDSDGNIQHQDDVITIFDTYPVKDEKSKKLFIDNAYDVYYIENYNIKSQHTNSDNTLVTAKDTKVYKISTSGQILKTFEVPEGKDIGIAKKENYYYVASGIYTRKNNTESYISVNIYKLDENLELINSTTYEHTSDNYIDNDKLTNYRSAFKIMSDKGKILIFIKKNSGFYDYNHFEVQEDLQLVNSDDYYSYKNYSKNPILDYKVEDTNYFSEYPEIVDKLVESEYLVRTQTQYGPDYNGTIKVTKDGENYIVNVVEKRKERIPNSTDYNYYAKFTIIYYDKNLNEIFQKQIYDWSIIGLECRNPIFDNSIIFQNYIMVLSDNNNEYKWLVLDKRGNIVKDLSNELRRDDLDIRSLSITNMFTFKNGINIEFSISIQNCDGKGASYDGEVLDEFIDPPTINHMMLYYSYTYNINTDVKGEGVVTSEFTSAIEGAQITFNVTPKEGYVLGEIKVTDKNGNVIKFHDYTFTMPDSDVLIEVIFVKNPNTKTFFSLSLIVIGLMAMISTYILIKSRNEYKKENY